MAKIDKHRWITLSPLLDELLDADEAERNARLASIRRGDGTLADELAALLQQQASIEQERFLEGSAVVLPNEPSLAGQQVGSYTLERLLGRGGMGAVWLARRSDGRYEGRVAIKLLHVALLGPQGADRFKREGSALARLTHPNIGRLIDAGVTSVGHPYLVLEYVEGETIDRWCDNNALDVAARVRLFQQVLAAVAHAHSKLILHRDLKPSNILVTAEGQVKLLDFGIAKLLDREPGLGPIPVVTEFIGRAFTPEYAAPEQVQGGEVTTATDVYALGVLLYALLTAQHPTAGSQQTPVDKLRAIVDTDPVRPSEAVARSTITDGRTAIVDPARRVRQLRGDLDNIIAMALRKTPTERYRTAEALAEDLDRYLNSEPVSARPDSVAYRVTRFVARNRMAVAAAVIALLVVVGAAGVSVSQAREAMAQRDRARVLSARNTAVVDFVSSMLTEVAPAELPIHVADLLDRSQAILLTDESRPENKAAILNMLATYFLGAGDATKAQQLLTHSLELTRNSSDAALRAELLCTNARAASMLGRPQDAEANIREGLILSNGDSAMTAKCLQARAAIAQLSTTQRAAL